MAVIDETPECERAIRYAAMRAKNSNGGLVLLHVVEPTDFQHWLGVEEIMKAEAMEEAEARLAKAAGQVRETIGIDAETVVRQGSTREEIDKVIEEDKDIAILVLAAGSTKDGPGPLVASIASRGTAFPVAVTVIPADLSDEDIDALA